MSGAVEFVIVNVTYPTGTFHGVEFREEERDGVIVGVGRTSSPSVAAWFAALGYPVTPDPLAKRDIPVRASGLPADFPAREVLIAHGFRTTSSLTGMTLAKLQKLRGVGPARARAILEAL